MELDETQNSYWKHTKRLAIGISIILLLTVILVLVSHFAPGLSFFGFPLSFYLAAQGIMLAFIAIAFSFVIRQERLDHQYRVSEDL